MKLSKLISDAQTMMAEHGDIDVLDADNMYEVYSIHLLEVENDDDYPKDWNMPAGTKVCMINYG